MDFWGDIIMDILMLLPTFIIALLLLVCVLLAVFHMRLGREVYNLKIEVSMLKVEVANLGAGKPIVSDKSHEEVRSTDTMSYRAHS